MKKIKIKIKIIIDTGIPFRASALMRSTLCLFLCYSLHVGTRLGNYLDGIPIALKLKGLGPHIFCRGNKDVTNENGSLEV